MAYPTHGYSNHDRYLESQILTADPVRLIRLLHRAAIEAIAAARRHLAAGEIRERSRRITKAWQIVQELTRSLDPEAGDVGRSLARLYPYMQRRLLEANSRQLDAPLAEVEQLLTTLLEGWSAIETPESEAEPQHESVSCLY